MSRLSPEAEQLVRAGRSVLRPSDADRERVLSSLHSRFGAASGPEPGVTELARAPLAAKISLVKASSVLVGLAVLGGGAFMWLRPESQPNLEAGRAALIPPAITAPAALEVAEPSAPPEIAAPPEILPASPAVDESGALAQKVGPPTRARAARRRALAPNSDSLTREVALLSRASTELNAGRPAPALEALDEHARTFPDGALAQERSAARARVLCKLGRMEEGQAELAGLARWAPGSLHASRAAQACARSRGEKK